MLPTLAISKNGNVIARLVPNHSAKRFDIEVIRGATKNELKNSIQGTVRDGTLHYELDGKIYQTPIKTLRGNSRATDGSNTNRLRQWTINDFNPHPDDIFQERLYAVHWIEKGTLSSARPETYFIAVTEADIRRELRVEQIVSGNLAQWQSQGLVPDMMIEPGKKTDELIRTRGWTYWHHLFNARQLLLYAELKKHTSADLCLKLCQMMNTSARLTRWTIGDGEGRSGGTKQVFDNQALNTLYNYGCRASVYLLDTLKTQTKDAEICKDAATQLECHPAKEVKITNDIFVTDPPYADAINYHEITEFFIAWLRKNPPAPFDQWIWDSRRALAIKGDGEDFRQGMVDAYRAMANHMPDNGLQCVMFTHQDTGV